MSFYPRNIGIPWTSKSKKRVAFDSIKIVSVNNLLVPKIVKEMREFLGLRDYYMNFIRDCIKIARPLKYLTKMDAFKKYFFVSECISLVLKYLILFFLQFKLIKLRC